MLDSAGRSCGSSHQAYRGTSCSIVILDSGLPSGTHAPHDVREIRANRWEHDTCRAWITEMDRRQVWAQTGYAPHSLDCNYNSHMTHDDGTTRRRLLLSSADLAVHDAAPRYEIDCARHFRARFTKAHRIANPQ